MIEFFRHCPGCGRRFHIKLVEKDELGRYDTKSEGPMVGVPGRGGMVQFPGGRGVTIPVLPILPRGVAEMQEGPPMFFDIREFAYRYKCKHCGHEWTETRLVDKALEADTDPNND